MGGDPRRSVGARGEQLAAAHLARSGYRVLDRNFRTAAGELDLVAIQSGCVVFCEVRARIGAGSPYEAGGALESIGSKKRRRLRRMAREWLATQDIGSRLEGGATRLRFDAIGIVLSADGGLVALEHLEDAF